MTDVAQIIADIEAWVDKATTGPWVLFYDRPSYTISLLPAGRAGDICDNIESEANAQYIRVCSPDRIRALLDEVRRLRKKNDILHMNLTTGGYEEMARVAQANQDRAEAAEAELARLREPQP